MNWQSRQCGGGGLDLISALHYRKTHRKRIKNEFYNHFELSLASLPVKPSYDVSDDHSLCFMPFALPGGHFNSGI
jgi:hypothetical protein